MVEVKCLRCGYEFCPCCGNENLEIKEEKFKQKEESHHIHPRFMDNPKSKGKVYLIPKKIHDKLHGYIMKWVWEEVKDKKTAIKKIISKSKKIIGINNE